MRSPGDSRLLILSLVLALSAPCWVHAANAQDRRPHEKVSVAFDHRYGHNRYYPPRGQTVRQLPRDAHLFYWHGSTYYSHGGTWYRPARARWIVVTPPVGLFVTALPPFYTTIWIGGAPYYYANDVYYAWRPALGHYVVAEPPVGDATTAPQASRDEIYIYPKDGQSAEQQATDRYECHRWAVKETGFDPTQPAGGVAPDQSSDKREDYSRALTACLQGRGYSVK